MKNKRDESKHVEDAQNQNETPEMKNGVRLFSDPHNQMGGVI